MTISQQPEEREIRAKIDAWAAAVARRTSSA